MFVVSFLIALTSNTSYMEFFISTDQSVMILVNL